MTTRGPSAGLRKAIARIQCGETAYAAAKAEGLALSTVYRSPLYKALKTLRRNGQIKVREVKGLVR